MKAATWWSVRTKLLALLLFLSSYSFGQQGASTPVRFGTSTPSTCSNSIFIVTSGGLYWCDSVWHKTLILGDAALLAPTADQTITGAHAFKISDGALTVSGVGLGNFGGFPSIFNLFATGNGSFSTIFHRTDLTANQDVGIYHDVNLLSPTEGAYLDWYFYDGTNPVSTVGAMFDAYGVHLSGIISTATPKPFFSVGDLNAHSNGLFYSPSAELYALGTTDNNIKSTPLAALTWDILGNVTVTKSLKFPGSSSGTATIVAPSAASTPTLTLPTNTGTFALTSQLNSGTVTSVATTTPITGGTITSTGTIACSTCVTSSSPGAGVAHFAGSTQEVTSSAVVNADLSGQVGLAHGGTNADLSATGGTSQFLKQATSGAAITVARPACSDLSNAATSCSTDATNASNISSGTLSTSYGGAGNSGTTVGIGGFWAGLGTSVAAGSTTITINSTGNMTGNDVIHWQSFDTYAKQVVGHISFRVGTGVNPSTTDVGIYDKTGQTLLVNMGGVSTATSSANATASVTQVSLAPGTYIWAWCATSSGTVTNLGYDALNIFSDGVSTGASAATRLKNLNGTRYGQSSNACTAGVLPSALGTLSAGGFSSTSLPPMTWMEP